MNRRKDLGQCEHCGRSFGYYLIHNGFNDSAYAYSDTVCSTALLDRWKIPANIPVAIRGKIKQETEKYLLPAPGGGRFKASSSPRCPHCNQILDPVRASRYIEENAEGSKGGWRWQQSWDGMYCIIIEDLLVRDPYIT